MKVEVRGPGRLPAIEINPDVAQGQMLAEPMHVADDARHVKPPPIKRAAIEVEMQVGVVLSMHRDGAAHPGHRGLLELIRFNRAGDMRADRARDDHRLGRAIAVGQEDQLRSEVRAQAVRADLLRAALDAAAITDGSSTAIGTR